MLFALVAAAPEVVALPDDGPPWAELRIALPGGTNSDPKDKSGLAHVAAVMLERRLSSIGAKVILGRHGLAVSAGAPTAEIEHAAIAAIDAIAAEPVTAEVDAAVRIASQRRRRFADDDRALAEMELERTLGPAEHLLGAPESLATITRDDVLLHERRNWVADRTLVVISGRFDPEAPKHLAARLEKMTRPQVKKEAPAREAPARQPSLRVLLIDKPNRRLAQVAIGRRVPTIGAAELAANAGLGGSMSGRLTEAMLRTPAVGAYAFSAVRDDHLVVWSAVEPSKTAAAVTRILEALASVAKEGLAPPEILLGKRTAAAQAELTQRDAASRADAQVRAHLSALARTAQTARFLELGEDEVKRAARGLAASEGLAIVVVASATADLQAALVAVPGVKEVQVARYDLR